MITVTVNTDLVCGTDRGGEDLFLDFSAETPEKPDFESFKDLNNIKIVLGEEGLHNLSGSIDSFEAGRQVKLTDGQYEFEWTGTKGDLAKLASSLLCNKKNWSREVDSDGCKFLVSHFVGGNAE